MDVAAHQRGAIAAVLRMGDDRRTCRTRDRAGAIAGAVVDDEHITVDAYGLHLVEQGSNAVFLVECRNQDQKRVRRAHPRCGDERGASSRKLRSTTRARISLASWCENSAASCVAVWPGWHITSIPLRSSGS